MILDVVWCYLLLFLLYINTEIGKIDVKCLPVTTCMENCSSPGCRWFFSLAVSFLCCPFSLEMS